MPKRESKSKMLKRHRHTLRQLEEKKNKECKKEKDKAKRSEIAAKYREEIKRVTEEQNAEVATREAEEAAAAVAEAGGDAEVEGAETEGAASAAAASGGGGGSASAASAGSEVGSSTSTLVSNGKPKKLSRAAKRRLKEKERERRDAAAAKALRESGASAEARREAETADISRALTKLGLKVKPMAADGNCLFHAVADQLRLCAWKGDIAQWAPQVQVWDGEGMWKGPDHTTLRYATAAHMAKHMPEAFLIPAMEAAGLKDKNAYTKTLQTTAMYGGEPEVRALSDVLKAAIHVHSSDGKILVVGEQYQGKSDLHITFHRKYLVSANHYNSTGPL